MNERWRRVFMGDTMVGYVRDMWSDNFLISGRWKPATKQTHDLLLKALEVDAEADVGVRVTIEGERFRFLVRALDDDDISLRTDPAEPRRAP